MVVISISYHTTLAMSKEDALTLAGIFERAYKWEEKWVSKAESETEEAHYLYYAYPQEDMPSMKIVHDRVYEMAKLAGKPISKS